MLNRGHSQRYCDPYLAMAEGIECELAVVCTHATVAYTTKRKPIVACVEQGGVDSDTATAGVHHDALLRMLAPAGSSEEAKMQITLQCV